MDLELELPNQSYMKIIGFILSDNRTEACITLYAKVSFI